MVTKNAKPEVRKEWNKPELVRMGAISVAVAKAKGAGQGSFS